MLTEEDDVEIHALARRGWSVSTIARHTGRDRKTVRRYLAEQKALREPAASCLEPFRAYLDARFADDAHVLGDDAVWGADGFGGSIGRIRRWCARSASRGCVQSAGAASRVRVLQGRRGEADFRLGARAGR
jgi:transposase